MIKIENLSKSFGNLKALDNLSVNVNKGSVFGLVGSNGSGKSTLLRILSGVYIADSGRITIDGKTAEDNEDVKGICCFVSDFPYFSNNSTLKNTAILYRSIYPNWSEEKYNTFCKTFPIDCNTKIITMSKGMQRQAALILALSTCPQYLFLDEIFDGLDPVVRQLVKKLIIEQVAENNMSVIIASHNLRELEDFCDHIGFLHKGGILLEKELDDLKLDLHKIQVAYEEPLPENALSELNIVNMKSNGKMYEVVVRGDIELAKILLNTYNPVFMEMLPLTLEEIFISEMEVAGYDINNILK